MAVVSTERPAGAGIRPARIALAVVIFALSVVAFDRAFFAAFRTNQAPVDRRSELRRKLEGLPDKSQYELLILGTSRAYEAVHPAYISRALGIKAYKEAFQGKGPRYNYEFYQLYREIVGRPKWIVYGLDYFLFTITSEQWAMDRFNVRTAAAEQESPVRNGPLLTLANKPANDRAIVRRLERLQQEIAPSEEFDPERNVRDMEAYLGPPLVPPTEREMQARPEPQAFVRYPGVEGTYFTRLLDEWDAEGVGVMLIDTPDYIRTYELNYEHAAFVAFFEQLARKHKNVVFVDYSDPARFPLERVSFFAEGKRPVYNTNSHLSKDGAAAFSRIFLPDLKRFIDATRAR